MFNSKTELNEFMQTLTEIWAPEQLPRSMVLPGYVIDNVLNMPPGIMNLQYYGVRGLYQFEIHKEPEPTEMEVKLQEAYKQIAQLRKQLYAKID